MLSANVGAEALLDAALAAAPEFALAHIARARLLAHPVIRGRPDGAWTHEIWDRAYPR
jgi:hypothetical protein